MRNIEQQAETEELESRIIRLQNKLERLKDDFDHGKISKKEFDHWTPIYKTRLEEIQEELDIIEEQD